MDRDRTRCIIKQTREVSRDADGYMYFSESEIVCRTHHLTLFISGNKTPGKCLVDGEWRWR